MPYWNDVLSLRFMMTMCQRQVNHMHAHINQTMSSSIPLTNCPFGRFALERQQKKNPLKVFDFSKRISSRPTFYAIRFSMSGHTLCRALLSTVNYFAIFFFVFVEKRNSRRSKDKSMQFSYIAISRMLIFFQMEFKVIKIVQLEMNKICKVFCSNAF